MRPRVLQPYISDGRPCVPNLSGIRPDTHSLRGLTSSALVVRATGKCHRSRANYEIRFPCMLDLGHSAMKNARFWTGLVALMSPLTGMVLTHYGRLMEPRPEVHGRVMHHGRPIRGGMIFLNPENRERSADMMGQIDQNGYFSCRPEWWVDRGDRTRFWICVCPDPRQPRRDVPADGPPASSQAVVVVQSQLASGSETISPSRVVLASLDSPPADTPGQFAHPGAPRGSFDAQPGAMEVSLGTESVHIEIDLKD